MRIWDVNILEVFLLAPVAQLDRASVSGTEGHTFESCRVYHFIFAIPSKQLGLAIRTFGANRAGCTISHWP